MTHKAHLCAYFEVDTNDVPVFKHWGIYSSGPQGLTTHLGSSFYSEYTQVSSEDSFHAAMLELEGYVQAMYERFKDKGSKGALWRSMWRDLGPKIARRLDETGKIVTAQVVSHEKP